MLCCYYITLHHITLYYITLHYIKLYYIYCIIISLYYVILLHHITYIILLYTTVQPVAEDWLQLTPLQFGQLLALQKQQ